MTWQKVIAVLGVSGRESVFSHIAKSESCKRDLVERTNALHIKDIYMNHFNVFITVKGEVGVIIFPE